MTHAHHDPAPRPARPASVAPLKNVAACLALCEALLAAPRNMPNIGVFSGFSGYGKSMASQYVWNAKGAVYIEVRDYWTRKKFCQALLAELGTARPRGTIGDMMEEIIAVLGGGQRRLIIIDEADKLVDKGMIELVRDINQSAQVPVLLVGEELLPQKLEAFERVHNRVLDFVLAQPCDLADTRALARFLFDKLDVDDGLLDLIRQKTGGKARRIATTLNSVAEWARSQGATSRITAESYCGRIFDGVTPRRGEQRRAA